MRIPGLVKGVLLVVCGLPLVFKKVALCLEAAGIRAEEIEKPAAECDGVTELGRRGVPELASLLPPCRPDG